MSVSDPRGRQDVDRQAGDRVKAEHPLADLAQRLAEARRAGDPAPEELERLVSLLATRDIEPGDRLTSALEGLARWSESAKAAASQPAQVMAPPPSRRRAEPGFGAPAEEPEELETRLADFAKRLNERPKAPKPAPEPAPLPKTPPIASLRSALAEIAARQKALDGPDEPERVPQPKPAVAPAPARAPVATPRPAPAERASPGLVDELRAELDRLGRTVSDLPTRAEIDGLAREMAELANRLGQDRPARLDGDSLRAIDALVAEVDRMRSDAASPQMIVELAEELHAISSRLETFGPRSEAAIEALSRRVEEVRAELDHFPRTAAVEGVAAEIQSLIKRLDAQERVNAAIRAEIDGMPRAETVSDLGRQIDALTEGLKGRSAIGPALKALEGLAERVDSVDLKLDQIANRGDEDAERVADIVRAEIAPVARADALDGLGRQIEALTRTIAAQRPEPVKGAVEALSGRIDALTEAVAADRDEDRDAPFQALSGRIEGLGERVESMAAATRARGAAFERIEESVRTIAERLLASRADGGAEAAPAFAADVARIAENMDASGERIEDLHAAFSGLAVRIERSCADLGAHCVESAVTAAREAVGGETRQDDDVQDEIARALVELRASTAQSERRAADAIEALRATLDRLLERMEDRGPTAVAAPASVEPSRAERRHRPEESAADPTEAARAAARRAMAEIGEAEVANPPGRRLPRAEDDAAFFKSYSDLAPDHPIEPGASPRSERAGLPEPPQTAAQTAASFIAAARRAAAQTVADDQVAEESLPAAGPSRFAEALGALKARRKPLILGLAAALIVLAALYVASGMTGEQPEPAPQPAPQSQLAPAPEPRRAAENVAPPQSADETPELLAAERQEPAAPDVSPPPVEARPAETKAEAAPPPPKPSAQIAAPRAPARDLTDFAFSDPAAARGGAWKVGEPATTGSVARPGDELPERIGGPTLRMRAVSGDPSAQLEIADRLLDGRNVEPDAAAAARWLEKAAAQGLAPAQHRLGSLYEKGRGVTRDMQVARRWYEQAAASGNVRAMHNLGVVHAEGGLGKPDFGAATTWFRMSAERGLVDSQYNLAVLCARGMGGKRDLVEAYKWFALAAAQGDQDAARKRDEVGKALGSSINVAKAAVEQFRPRAVDAAANEVPAPAGGWDRVAEKDGSARPR
jgi:localization factor PodJL